jgi:hypothetical protein
LGVSVGLLGAGVYLAGLLSGVLALLVLGGYILLFEGDSWLRRTVVKAGVVVFTFGLLSALVQLIPNAINMVNHLFSVFGGSFAIRPLTSGVGFINTGLSILQTLVLIGLALNALKHRDFPVASFDKMVAEHTAFE